MGKKKKLLLVLALMLVITGIGGYFMPKSSKAEEENEKQVEGIVQRGNLQSETSVSGTISSGTDYEYCSVSLPPNILLEVEDIYAESGTEVATGDAILKVTEDSYKDLRAELLQQYENAKKDLSQAELDYKIDALTLLSDYTSEKAVADTAYENYNNSLEILSLDVEAVKVELEEAKSIIENNPAKISHAKKYIKEANQKLKKYQKRKKQVVTAYEKTEQAYKRSENDYQTSKDTLEKIKIAKEYVENYTKKEGKKIEEYNTNVTVVNTGAGAQETNAENEETDLNRFVAYVTEEEQTLQKKFEQSEKVYLANQKKYESKKQKKEELEEKIVNLKEKISGRKAKKEKYAEELEDAKKTINGLEAKYKQAISTENTGTVQAEKELKENLLSDESALTSYEVQLSSLKDSLQEVKESYKTAKKNWNLFKECFSDGIWEAQRCGILSYIGYDSGSFINNATPVVGYDNSNTLSVELTIDQSQIASIAVGDSVSVSGSFRNEITGTVASISNTQNSQSVSNVTYAVVVTVENTGDSFVSGDTVSVTFEKAPIENVLYISSRLVQNDEQGNYVLLKSTDGTITRKEVTTGISNNMFTEIKEGVSEGDCCIVKKQIEQEEPK